VRAELLPAVPPGRAPSGSCRHIDEPRRFPLRCSSDGRVEVTDGNASELGFFVQAEHCVRSR
jgi:hypothetical protein